MGRDDKDDVPWMLQLAAGMTGDDVSKIVCSPLAARVATGRATLQW